jgi:hypothetical protein
MDTSHHCWYFVNGNLHPVMDDRKVKRVPGPTFPMPWTVTANILDKFLANILPSPVQVQQYRAFIKLF